MEKYLNLLVDNRFKVAMVIAVMGLIYRFGYNVGEFAYYVSH